MPENPKCPCSRREIVQPTRDRAADETASDPEKIALKGNGVRIFAHGQLFTLRKSPKRRRSEVGRSDGRDANY